MPSTKAVVLRKRPVDVTEDCFESIEEDLPELADGDVLVRTVALTIDPIIRIGLVADTYMPAVEFGEVVRAMGSGVVVESAHPTVKPGDSVFGWLGWREQSVCRMYNDEAFIGPPLVYPTGSFRADDPSFAYASGFLASWISLVELGRVQPGDTVLISGASGGVGVVAGQMAKRLGATVVGITSTAEKAEWLCQNGFDDCVLHTQPALPRRIRKVCDPIAVFLDNTGGAPLDAGISWLAKNARVVLCGAASAYDSPEKHPFRYMDRLIYTRSTMQGFVVSDHGEAIQPMMDQCAAWANEQPFVLPTTMFYGLESAPAALADLFSGKDLIRPWVMVSDI